ncbi:hypothetical protein D3C72_2514060 [compost metagenome]
MSRQQRQCLAATCGSQYPVVLQAQLALQGLENAGIVVDQQQALLTAIEDIAG